MARHTLMVFTNPVEGKDEEYNRWYNERHLKDVLAVEGFVSAQRFRIAGLTETAPYAYLAIYELEGDDAGIAMKRLADAINAGMEISDAMDRPSVWACAPLTEKVTP